MKSIINIKIVLIILVTFFTKDLLPKDLDSLLSKENFGGFGKFILKRKKRERKKISFDMYKEYEGKKISQIVIINKPPFNETNDTTLLYTIAQSLNNVKIPTQERVIRANLFVKEGDSLNSAELVQNSIYLNSLPYFNKVRFTITDDKEKEDSINLFVTVEEKWTLNFTADIINERLFNFEVVEKNFLGSGYSLEGNLLFNADFLPRVGYGVKLNIPNKDNFNIDKTIYYRDDFDSKKYGFRSEKKILNSTQKFGGGIQFERIGNYVSKNSLKFRDESVTILMFLHRQLKLKKRVSSIKSIIFSPVFIKKHFIRRGIVKKDSMKLFHNRNYFGLSTNLSKNRILEASSIFSVDDKYSFYTGLRYILNFGFEYGEYRNRYFLGGDFEASILKKDYYNGFKVGLSSFFTNRKYEQIKLYLNYRGFSKRFSIDEYLLRFHYQINLTSGFNRFSGEYLKFSGENIFRGYTKNKFKGTKRLQLKFEPVLFTNWSFYDFTTALFGFTDINYIDNSNSFSFKSKRYYSFGIGIRVSNLKLIFGTFEFYISYLPDGVIDQDYYRFNMLENKRYNPYNNSYLNIYEFN